MASWENIRTTLDGMKPTILMVIFQTVLAFVNIGYKLAANDGMHLPILVAYRFMFGAAFIVPVAYFAERKKRPKLTRKVALYGFLCGLFGGSLGQNLYLKSLDLTSATFASAMMNLIPAMTFIVAVCLRIERLGWNSAPGKAKVFGTLLGIGGAMLLTFYQGPELDLWNTGINLLETTTSRGRAQDDRDTGDFVFGASLALASCVCYSLWLIVQAKATEKYPCPYSITAMMTLWASTQGTLFALCTERNWSDWILGWDIRLLTVFVAGVLGSGVMFTFVAWCVRKRGPLFVSIFNPLLLVLVAIAGSLFLEEKLHLGMVLGAMLIVGGLYIVLWGKGEEVKKASQLIQELNQQQEQESQQVQSNMPSTPPSRPSVSGGRLSGVAGRLSGVFSRLSGASRNEAEDDETRDSHASSDILGSFYIYP